jgi:hypothetical protein
MLAGRYAGGLERCGVAALGFFGRLLLFFYFFFPFGRLAVVLSCLVALFVVNYSTTPCSCVS